MYDEFNNNETSHTKVRTVSPATHKQTQLTNSRMGVRRDINVKETNIAKQVLIPNPINQTVRVTKKGETTKLQTKQSQLNVQNQKQSNM